MKRAVFAVAFCFFCGILLEAAELFDPVVLENDYLKLTVDRQRGATLRSLIDKLNHVETAREFLSGKHWSGALAEDRLAHDAYPGEITRLKYVGQRKRIKNGQVLKLVSRQENGKYSGWEFVKTYRLMDGARYVDVHWQITNISHQKRTVTPWVHNIINRQFHNTVLPKKSGVKLIPPSADYFNNPARNWLGGYNPNSRQMIYFATDYKKILKHYYCFWNQYHALEWTFRATNLRPGSQWSGIYRIGLASPATIPVAVAPDAVVAYQWRGQQLEINLNPTANLGKTEFRLLVNGRELQRKNFVFNLGKSNFKLNIPAAKIAAPGLIELKIFQNGKERRQFQAKSPNPLLFSVDALKHRSVSDFPLLPWPSPESPYRPIAVRQHPAQIHFQNPDLSVGEISPYEKFFEHDGLKNSNCQFELRSLRNSRTYRQFVIRNNSAAPVTVKIQDDSLQLRQKQAVLPCSIRQIGYVETQDPSAFIQELPVGRYPDPLLPLNNCLVTIPAHQAVPLFLEIFVPFRQCSGVYTGKIAMTSGKFNWTIPVSCQVMENALPRRSLLRSTLGCWGVASSLLDEVGYQQGAKNFQQACQKICLQNRLTPRENGVIWSFDAAMEKQLEKLNHCHVTSVVIPPFVVKKPALFAKAIAALKRHNLYTQAFYYTIDEAPADLFPKVKAECQKIHLLYPDFKILGTIYEKDVSALFGDINIWCRGSIAQETWHHERRLQGDEIMSSNLPQTYLETSGIAPLLTFLKMKQCDYTGFLYWNIIGGYGKDNPWKNISCAGVNGNAHLLYPHRSGPLETLRWKYIAHGVEMFDLLSILQKKQPQEYHKLIKTSYSIKNCRQMEKFRSSILNYFQ